MRVLTILAHPHPGSFNHAIAEAAVAALEASGHEIVFHDLYAEGFDPLLSSEEIPKGAQIDEALARHCRDLSEAEGIIVVHPNWWGMPPAILKGWVDRVVRPGVAYEFLEGDSGEGVPGACSGPGRPWSSIPPTPGQKGSGRPSAIPCRPCGKTASSASAGWRISAARATAWW